MSVARVFLALTIAGCGSEAPAEPDAAVDAAPIDSAPSEDAALPDAEPMAARPGGRALILDQELAHVSAWVDVIEAMETAGLDVTYRRFFPHLTTSDVTLLDDGSMPFDVIILAAGRAPSTPTSRMREAEIELAATHAQRGGILLLADQAGHLDSPSGANDWYVQNRILETLEVPIRIDRATLLGDIYIGDDGPLPHRQIAEGYPGGLEEALGYPFVLTTQGHPTARALRDIAAGIAPNLRVASDDVQVLLRTYPADYAWQRVTGTPEVVLLDDETPVAAVARASLGYACVIPRSVLTLGAVTGQMADKPVLEADREANSQRFVASLFTWLASLRRGERELEVVMPMGDDVLFAVSATNRPAEGDDVIQARAAIDDRALPPSPPTNVDEALPPMTSASEVPEWLKNARIAYGDVPPADSLDEAFDELASHHIDVLLTPMSPENLVGLAEDAFDAQAALPRSVADHAEAAGATWVIGGFLNSMYVPRAAEMAKLIGTQGQTTDAPDPLDETLWDDVWLPTCDVVGRLAEDHPGLRAYHVDLELYNGPLVLTDGWAFGDASMRAYADEVGDPDLATLPASQRFDTLVERGELGAYYATLERLVAARATECRERATAHRSDLAFSIYALSFPNGFFGHGLLRGLGTEAQPAALLTFDAWTGRADDVLASEGLRFAHLGGTLVSFFEPDTFGKALESLARANGGYWYLSYNDFSVTQTPPRALHGEPAAYWAAVDAAHARLED